MSLLHAVGWALVHFLWQGVAIAAVLAIALVVARRAPASFRYALCAVAMLFMIAVPVGTVVRLHYGAAPMTPAAAVATRDPAPGSTAAPVDLHERAAATAETHTFEAGDAATVSPFQTLRLALEQRLHWLVALWVLGVFLLSVRLLGGFLRARQLTQQGTSEVPAPWRRTLARLAQQLGIRTGVRVMQSALVMVPVVIGWLRPVILLPGTVFTGLTPQQLEAILAHELAHIRRHDYLVNLVQAAIETVLFYHPAVWWVSSRLRAEREHCCDDLAVAACGDARGYAAALVDMERLRGAALAYALGAGGGGGGSLVTRVRRLLAPSFSRSETAPRWAAGAIAVVAALAIGGVSGVPAAVAQRSEPDALLEHEAATAQRAQPPDTVVKHPDPLAPLADRWAWAEREARRVAPTGYWVGYTITPPATLEHMVYIDRNAMVHADGVSMSGRMFGDFKGLRFQGQSIVPFVGSGSVGSIKLLFEYRGTGQLARIHASTFELPVDLGGRALLWLGAATDQQSLAVVQPLYGATSSVEMKEQVIDAIGVHGSSALVVPALERYLGTSEPNAVRAHAAEWLGSHPVQPALVLLARLTRSDRSSEVRREAAEAIGEMDLPAATDTLIALVRTLPDVDVRREAVEGLGHKNDARARAALDAVAREDRNPDVQREAVETLGELDGPQGIAALREIARTHPNVDVRREAVETLGEALPSAEVVALLTDIANRDRSADVQREAVETLGEVGTNEAHTAVLAVARSHPDAEVRREAIETLSEGWPSDETVEELARIARDDRNQDVQREAVETLGAIGQGLGLGVVVELAMTHPQPDVRREAVETVGEFATPAEALRVLRDVVRNDQSIDVQEEALETLFELHHGAGIPAVIDVARSHKNREIRQSALRRLAESDDPRARAIFERALGNP